MYEKERTVYLNTAHICIKMSALFTLIQPIYICINMSVLFTLIQPISVYKNERAALVYIPAYKYV